jgi:hypothetical protein
MILSDMGAGLKLIFTQIFHEIWGADFSVITHQIFHEIWGADFSPRMRAAA